MKRSMTIPLAVLLVAVLAVAAPVAARTGGLRYTITVSKFENSAGYAHHWSIGDAWGAVMTDMLNQTGQFIVLGETDMRNEAMAEQDFGRSGRTAQGAKTPVVGQMTPAQLLVKGDITHVEYQTGGGSGGIRIDRVRIGGKKDKAEVNATIYIVDSTTGQVVASTRVIGTAARRGATFGYSGRDLGTSVSGYKKDNMGKAIEAAVSDAVDWLTAQLPGISWRGSVALIKDGKVYVNRGSREGVTAGQVFFVGEPEVIRDPDTGEVLDETMTEVATIRVDSVREKLSICSVIGGDAGAVERGMAVHTTAP